MEDSVLIGTESNAVQVLEAVAHLPEPDGGGIDTYDLSGYSVGVSTPCPARS